MSGRRGAVVCACAVVLFATVILSGGVGVGTSAAAELRVVDADLAEETIVEGEIATITATVENGGNQTETFTAELETEADGVINDTDVEVGPNETRTVEFAQRFNTTGTYRLGVNDEPAGTLNVTEPSSPEFNVTEVTLSNPEITVGETVTVTAEIANTGDANGTYSAELATNGTINSTLTESKSVEVAAGETSTVEFTPSFDTGGDYTVGVGDGPTKELTVVESEPANVSVATAELSEATINPGETVTVTATVVNEGGTAGEFTADLRVDGRTRDSQTLTVDAGNQTTTEFTPNFTEAGTYEIAVGGEPAGNLTVSEPAEYEVSNAQLGDDTVSAGDAAVASAEVTNVGEIEGTFTVGFSATGQDGTTRMLDTRSVTLTGGESQRIELRGAIERPGEYTISVDDTAVGNVTVVEPQNNGGGGGGSSDSSDSGGSAPAVDAEPTVDRSESDEAVTVDVDGATGERYDFAVDLAGPSDSQPAVSVSSVEIDPAGDPGAYEATIGRPTAEPDGRDPVPHGEALGYVEFGSSLDAAGTSAATLRFDVDEETIPRGLGRDNVVVLRAADDGWTTANVTHEMEGDTHTVTLPHATPVAVVALEPGRVEVVEGEVPADRVRVGYETTLRATVRNPGDRPATRNLTVGVNGESVTEREVTLDSGESATIEIRFQPPESGTVSLGGTAAGEIELFGENHGTSPDSETDEGVPGFGVPVTVLALLVTALAVRSRRS